MRRGAALRSGWGEGADRAKLAPRVLNLSHCLALGEHDLTSLEERLSARGLCSLGRGDSHVELALDTLIATLRRLTGESSAPYPAPAMARAGVAELEAEADLLFGKRRKGARARVMGRARCSAPAARRTAASRRPRTGTARSRCTTSSAPAVDAAPSTAWPGRAGPRARPGRIIGRVSRCAGRPFVEEAPMRSWIPLTAVLLAAAAKGDTRRVLNHAKVLAEPKYWAKSVSSVDRGQDVKVLGEKGGWIQVELNGRKGFVPQSAFVDDAASDLHFGAEQAPTQTASAAQSAAVRLPKNVIVFLSLQSQ